MVLTWILLGIIVALCLLNMIMLEWPSLRALYIARKIHGPRVIPIIGGINVLLIVTFKGPEIIMDIIKEHMRKFPRFVNFPVGGVINILIQKPDDAQVVLNSVNHIQKGREYKLIEPWLNQGLLTSFGTKWHARRKLLTPTFHFRILEDSMAGINKCTTILADLLSQTKGTAVKVENYVTKCALDIIGDTAMGINLESQKEAGESYLKSIKRTSAAVVLRIISVWQFHDYMFNISQNGRTFYKNVKTLHEFTDKTIKERKEIYKEKKFKIDDDTGYKSRTPFLDCLLETQKNNPQSLSDLDIREEVDTFMFEGHDTTSAAISFALWLLGTFPEEQEKVYEELKEIFGNEERDVTMTDTCNMVYLEKVIKETLRLYPSVPYISRTLNQDCILDDGTVLPSTANIVIIPYLIHREPEHFPDPEKFDPERFSEENSVKRHPFAYIPFSAGPRNCIGQKFAMLEMKVTLAKILRKLQVTAITRRDEFKVIPYLIIRPTIPLQVKFTPRATLPK